MEERKTIVSWVQKHKTELLVFSVAVGTAVGTTLIVKNWDSISAFFKQSEAPLPQLPVVEKTVNKTVVPVISHEILDNLSGNKLTARDLGNITLCSAQKINKRIVDAGLAVKRPNGEYAMTEAGQLLGTTTWKTTAAGHTFSNIEWDEKILDLIFSPKELKEIEAFKEKAQQILDS